MRLANAEQGKSNPTMDVEGDPQEWFRLHIKLAPPPVLTCVRARCSLPGPHEIVSLVGTFSSDGTCHLHASFGDAAGRVVRKGSVFDVETGCVIKVSGAGLATGQYLWVAEGTEWTLRLQVQP